MFIEILPAKGNIQEVVADMINMFVEACEKYDDEFLLDSMCNRGGFLIGKKKG